MPDEAPYIILNNNIYVLEESRIGFDCQRGQWVVVAYTEREVDAQALCAAAGRWEKAAYPYLRYDIPKLRYSPLRHVDRIRAQYQPDYVYQGQEAPFLEGDHP